MRYGAPYVAMYAGRIFLGVDVINQKQSVEQKKVGQGWLAVAGSCWTGTAVALCVEVGAVVDVAPEACRPECCVWIRLFITRSIRYVL